MGVKGLWQLINVTGEAVPLESLDSKVLAIDVSLWLNQAIKGRQSGGDQVSAALETVFHRVCKLLYFNIKPIFVFDGCTPELKRATIERRRQARRTAEDKALELRLRVLRHYMRVGAERFLDTLQRSDTDGDPAADDDSADDAAVLEAANCGDDASATVGVFASSGSVEETDGDERDPMEPTDPEETGLSARVRDFLESCGSLGNVDPDSAEFKRLPDEAQYHVLLELTSSKSRVLNARLGDVDSSSAESFSGYQFAKLLRQGHLTRHLDQLRRRITQSQADRLLRRAASSVADGSGRIGGGRAAEWISAGRGRLALSKIASEAGGHALLISAAAGRPTQDWGDLLTARSATANNDKADADEEEASSSNKSTVSADVVGNFADDLEEILDDSYKAEEPLTDEQLLAAGGQLVAATAAAAASGRRGRPSVDPSVEPMAAADVEPESNADVEPESNADVEPESNADVEPESNADVEPESNADVEPESNADVEPESNADVEPESNADVEPESNADVEPESNANVEPESNADVEPESNADVEPESNADVEPESNANVEPESIADVEPESNANVEPESIADVEPNSPVNVQVNFDLKSRINLETTEEQDSAGLCSKTAQEKAGVQVVEPSTIAKPTKQSQELEDVPAEVRHDDQKEAEEAEDDDDEDFEEVPMLQSPTASKTAASTSKKVPTVFNKASFLFGANASERISAATERQQQQQQQQQQPALTVEATREQLARVEARSESVSQLLVDESRRLISLFGLPVVLSPEEAEAQCARLEQLGLTEGTITDDSDVWLFGARRVYRYVFSRSQQVRRFTLESIQHRMGLDREAMVDLALMCGSDYTDGVPGLGPVTAMEMLAEFGNASRLRQWLDEQRNCGQAGGEVGLTPAQVKALRLEFPPSFPSLRVANAYLKPAVDSLNSATADGFVWGRPDLDLIRRFAADKMGWSREKCDGVMLPLMRRISSAKTQSLMDKFVIRSWRSQSEAAAVAAEISAKAGPKTVNVGNSRRVGLAVGRLRRRQRGEAIDEEVADVGDVPEATERSPVRKSSRRRKK